MSNLGLTDEINEKEKLTDDIKDEYKEDPIKEILVLKSRSYGMSKRKQRSITYLKKWRPTVDRHPRIA